MSSRQVLTTSLLAALLLVSLGACGGTRGYNPYPPTREELYVAAYLAPGAPATLPTTVRVMVSVWHAFLPLTDLSLDPDGDGDAPGEEVQSTEYGKMGLYTEFYFDYEWEGPDGTRGVVLVTTAGGTFGDALELTLEWLPSWPY